MGSCDLLMKTTRTDWAIRENLFAVCVLFNFLYFPVLWVVVGPLGGDTIWCAQMAVFFLPT